ncbi:hypothetical protein DFH09DRAFT_1088903 [Mycena vulgaris]|nr:hypothetical protein DFH09DRAFT_1088903 [Mycena vulgaris]
MAPMVPGDGGEGPEYADPLGEAAENICNIVSKNSRDEREKTSRKTGGKDVEENRRKSGTDRRKRKKPERVYTGYSQQRNCEDVNFATVTQGEIIPSKKCQRYNPAEESAVKELRQILPPPILLQLREALRVVLNQHWSNSRRRIPALRSNILDGEDDHNIIPRPTCKAVAIQCAKGSAGGLAAFPAKVQCESTDMPAGIKSSPRLCW